MCRLFGVKNYLKESHLALASEFLRLASAGRVPEGSAAGHTDGWGLSYYDASGSPLVVKSGGSAIEEKDSILSALDGISSTAALILHLRKSSWPGTASERHAHPFAFGKYVFAHNGTVEDYRRLSGEIPRSVRPPSDSLDTEVLFRFLVGRVSAAPVADIAETLRAALADVAARQVHTSLTSLFSDGDNLYAFREHTKRPDYYTLHAATLSARSTVVSSEPLNIEALKWRPLIKGELIRL